MYTPTNFCSSVYLSQVHASIQPVKHIPWYGCTTWLPFKLRDIQPLACLLKCWCDEQTQPWEKTNNTRLYAVHVQLLFEWKCLYFIFKRPSQIRGLREINTICRITNKHHKCELHLATLKWYLISAPPCPAVVAVAGPNISPRILKLHGGVGGE